MVTASAAELLQVAMQDLLQARRTLVDRLPVVIAAASDPRLRTMLAELSRAAEEGGADLRACLSEDGPPCLWAGGIMDDAERDTHAHRSGVLKDVALVGAVRKWLAADIVSLETAVALAGQLSMTRERELCARLRACSMTRVAALREQLAALAAASPSAG